MDFKLPIEFESFVTSAEDLLKEFGTHEDGATVFVSCHWLYTDSESSCGSNLATAIEYQRKIAEIIDPLIANYLWHKDQLFLTITYDYDGALSLQASVNVGDSVDDEWFIVYIMLEISKCLPKIAISVYDSDGQFLLMEAADHIDDWLGPENADNRVWIHEGQCHIIPFDEPGKLKSGGMRLDKALHCILSNERNKTKTAASKGVQRTIYERTIDVYPAKVAAYSHVTLCVMPVWLANLIQKYPFIISRAVEALSNTDKDYLRKAYTMNKQEAQAQLIVAPVRMTRALYAQLTFKNFQPPRKYHAMMRRAAEANSRKVQHAFELGCRLACGVECAMYDSFIKKNKSTKECRHPMGTCSSENPVWQEVLILAGKSGYLTVGTETDAAIRERLDTLEALFMEQRLISTANYARLQESDPRYPDGFYDFVSRAQVSLDKTHSCCDIDDTELFRAVTDGLAKYDDDSWLYMRPEELDVELQDRMERFKAAGTGTETAMGPSREEENAVAPEVADLSRVGEVDEETNKLQGMLDGLKAFVAGSSDIDGVSFPSEAIGKACSTKDRKSSPQSGETVLVTSKTGALVLDYDYMKSILSTVNTTTDTTAPTDAPSTDTSCRMAESNDLKQYFSSVDLEEPEADADESSDESSDDDEETSAGKGRSEQRELAADSYIHNILYSKTSKSSAETEASHTNTSHEVSATGFLGVGGGLVSKSGVKSRTSEKNQCIEIDSDDEVEDTSPTDGDGIEEEEIDYDSLYESLDPESIKKYQVLYCLHNVVIFYCYL